MQSTIQRILTIGAAVAALGGLAAGSAQAAVSTTTLPATAVATRSAFLNGIVATGGAAVKWEFEYGQTTRYGKTTRAQVIPAGQGSVTVLDRVGGLKPGTRYHFRLDAQMGSGTSYYPLVIHYGQDRSFTTKKLGRLNLTSTKLLVRKGSVSIPLKCASTQSCKGKLTLTVRVRSHKKFRTFTLASESFTIRAGGKSTLKPKLSTAALSLLNNARGHRLGATLTARLSTGQPKLTKHVTLIRR